MFTSILRRLAPGAAAAALGLSASLATAQQGTTPPGPPVNRPETSRNDPTTGTVKSAPGSTQEVLPGVPATARDPAPPGTRGVRVDLPRNAGPADGNRPAGATGNPAGQANPAMRIYTAEGVVTRIDRAGKNINGELERFAFDPSQDWFSYTSRGVTGVPEKSADRPKTNSDIKDANAKQHEDAPDKPKVLEMAITKRTYTYAMARALDGTDQYRATTAASPDSSTSVTGTTRRVPTVADRQANAGPKPSNFTNLKEGSFVAVRYRKVGDVNEVLNLTLIDLPLNSDGSEPTRGATNGTNAANGTNPNVRTPAVPLTPVGAALPR